MTVPSVPLENVALEAGALARQERREREEKRKRDEAIREAKAAGASIIELAPIKQGIDTGACLGTDTIVRSGSSILMIVFKTYCIAGNNA